MNDTRTGILAMVAACTIWGLSPLFYRLLSDVPPLQVLGHRALWSALLFAGVLAAQGRLREVGEAFSAGGGDASAGKDRWRAALVVLAMACISLNWFLFIWATMIGRNTETSLGYFISPLIAVLLGRLVYGERLSALQWVSVGLAMAGVVVLTAGLGAPPWISLTLAITFAIYGALKKAVALGPVVSVTAEVLVFVPFALGLLAWYHLQGQGSFGTHPGQSVLLMLSGPMTAVPLILFSAAARRIPLATVGILQYINPSLQLLLAAAIFGEVLSFWHWVAFPAIWAALALYSLALWRQDRGADRAVIAADGVSATVTNPASEASAKP